MIIGLQGETRVTIVIIIAVTVIASPISILANSTQVLSLTTTDNNLNRVDISNYHSSPQTSGPSSSSTSSIATPPPSYSQDSDFTTQAALSLTRATQTSNIVDSKAYYDISFRTSTAGVIKFIRMSFPADTYVGASLLVEVTGIGPGTISVGAGGNTLSYTVTNAVNVPANTKIRIQIANANNPPEPSNSLTVSITTRDSANTIIDGPTSTNAYNIEQIGSGQIADGAIIGSKIAGTQKLLFAQCSLPAGTGSLAAGADGFLDCSVSGAQVGDVAVVEYTGTTSGTFNTFLSVVGADVSSSSPNTVTIVVRNLGPASIPLDNQKFSIIVFKPIAFIDPL